MFNLIKKPNAVYEVRARELLYSGPLSACQDFMINTLGFYLHDILAALDDMDKNKTDVAEFGMYRTFIFSARSETLSSKVTDQEEEYLLRQV